MTTQNAPPASALYQQIVLEHSRAPRHFGSLDGPTHAADGDNPLCGDALHVDLSVVDGCIARIAFRSEACAITRATASLLGDRAGGTDAATIADLELRFKRVVNGEIAHDDALGDLNALAALAQYPTRRKCAFLPFATLRAALAGVARTTTEGHIPMIDAIEAPVNHTVTFRNAQIADIPAIVALVTSAYRGDASRKGWTTEADLLDGQRIDPEGVAETIGKIGSRIILAERRVTNTAGAVQLLACCNIAEEGQGCYFGMFAVDPTLQGGGVGKLMMVEAERVAREDFGCVRMEMTVISIRDDLVAWYERRGYRRSGIYKPFPYGDERFGIPKRDDLRFEVLLKTL